MPNNGTFKIILKQVGHLQILLGFVFCVPMLVSLIFGEYYSASGFLISSVITLTLGYVLYKGFKNTPEPLLRHALIIAALGWLMIAVMGSLPFLIIAYITPSEIAQQFVPVGESYTSSLIYFKNPLHAIFESMSAYTTTGLTMAVHEPSIGKGLLFYRSFAQWVGGAGFIVLALAVFQQVGGKSVMFLFGSETSSERLKPTIIDTARSIWKMYLGLTLFSTIYLIIGTLIILPDYNIIENIFDSVNHAMTGQSTGGFSTLDDSIAGYKSMAMDNLYLLPMILGSLAIPFYVKVIFGKQFSLIWKDSQTKAILILCFFGSIIMSLFLMSSGNISEPFRIGVFQFISSLTTTGWQTSDVNIWNSPSIAFILLPMIIGGAAGATVGGIKIYRVITILKGVNWNLNRYFMSANSVQVVELNKKRILPDEMNKELASVATFSFMYLLIVFISAFITYFLSDNNYSLAASFFESASASGTVGLSAGITNPDMSPVIEITYIFQMWTGRLEIIPILVLFRAILFGTKPFLT
jgi:trk system potassium uptake protein TrkH